MTQDGGIKLKPVSILRGEKVLPLIAGMTITEPLKNFLKGLPSMIRQNGLGQTIAFLRSKDDEGYRNIADMLAKLLINGSPDKTSEDLMQIILGSDLKIKKYIAMQREAIEYAGWIKRFALALYTEHLIEREESDGTSSS